MPETGEFVKKYCRACGWEGMAKYNNSYCTQCHQNKLALTQLEVFVPIDAETNREISHIGQFTDLSASQVVNLGVKLVGVMVKLIAAVVGLRRDK